MEEQDQDDNMTQDSSGVDQIVLAISALSAVRTVDEPYMGQEFVSEAEAHPFYNAHATRVGFVIRVSNLSRSRHDGSVIVPYNKLSYITRFSTVGIVLFCPIL
ncbi:hypothetical protein RYX36_008294 [Vicia faba]